MTSKFAALAANVTDAFRVELLDPITDLPIKDKDGKVAFIEIYSTDSEAGRSHDKDARARMRRAAMKSRDGNVDVDPVEENMQKAARLTKTWHLVDPTSREVIDVPCTPDNALELYSEPGMNWLFVQVWVGATNPANFMKRSPKT